MSKSLFFLIVAASLLGAQTGISENEAEDRIKQLFDDYLHLASILSDIQLVEHPPSEGDLNRIKKSTENIIEQLMSDTHATGSVLAKEYLNSRASGATERPTQILGFARRTGLAKSQFRSFAREVINSTDLDAPRDPMLTTALEYLSEHGEGSDLDLMSRLDGHVNQTYAQIKNRFAARLRERLAFESASDPVNLVSAGTRNASSATKNVVPHDQSNEGGFYRNSIVGIAALIVIGLGILFVIRWVISRSKNTN